VRYEGPRGRYHSGRFFAPRRRTVIDRTVWSSLAEMYEPADGETRNRAIGDAVEAVRSYAPGQVNGEVFQPQLLPIPLHPPVNPPVNMLVSRLLRS